jgi:hypothetical protein
MKTLTFAILSFVCLALCQCSIEPVVYSDAKGREVAWLGGSVLTKSKGLERRIVRADGTVLESKTAERNETAVPVTGAMVGMGETLLNKAPGVVNALKK